MTAHRPFDQSNAIDTSAIEVIDSHVHIFSTEKRCRQLNWLRPGHHLDKPHGYQNYEAAGTPASSVIFVECDTINTDDYDAVLEEVTDASSENRVVAIIAWAPMQDLAECKYHLKRIRSVDTRNLLRGIRVLLQDKPDGFCLTPAFIDCARYLGTQGLLFEIGIDYHRRGTIQLTDAIDLIQSCPETVFVINHLAKPSLETSVTESYSRLLSKFAACPNVYMKLSGCFTEMAPNTMLPNDILFSHIELNVKLFGAHRLLFGSDWPVLCLSQAGNSVNKTPQGWFDYCKSTLHALEVDVHGQRQIFGLNAKRVYNIIQ